MEPGGAAKEGGGGVRKRLREFRVALSKYEHLSGVRVDKGHALKFEEAELTVEEELLGEARNAVARGVDFEGYMQALEASGRLVKLASTVSSILGYSVESLNYEEALSKLAAGGDVGEEERVAFAVVQGAARAYARAYEEAVGRVEKLTAECPVCGGVTDLVVRRDDGYYAVCPFCYYEWRIGSDLACPYCGSRDRIGIGIFMDRSRRVGLAHCQTCGTSWKVILDPSIRAPRSILPLIALAAEKYRSLIPGNQE